MNAKINRIRDLDDSSRTYDIHVYRLLPFMQPSAAFITGISAVHRICVKLDH